MKGLSHIQLKPHPELLPVVHVSTAQSWRGGEKQIVLLFNELKKKEIPQLIVCREGSELAKHCVNENMNVVTLKRRSGTDVFAAFHLNVICKKVRAGIVHAHDANAHTTAYLSALLFRNKTPVVVSRRVDFPIKRGLLSKLKYNFSTLKTIICVSNKIKEVIKPAVRNHQKLTTIYSGIDFSSVAYNARNNKLREILGISNNIFLIGNIAAIADHKDFFTFVDTAEKILNKTENVHFVIIGDGPLRKEIESYIHQKGLSEKISLTGFRADVQKLIFGLDLFLFTSKTEGLGTSILDAMHAGIPVVATRAGGIPEIITHAENSFLADVKDASGLSENVLILRNDAEKRAQLIAKAKETVKSFSAEKMAEKTLQLYKDIFQKD